MRRSPVYRDAAPSGVGAIHLVDTLAIVDRLDEAARFERHVDRRGPHHLWLGSRNPQRGTGKLKVDGRQVTAHRRAWELARGAPPAGASVLPCPDEPLCVRVDHLRLSAGRAGGAELSLRKQATTSRRVQVQVNGVRVHRRVKGDRGEVESIRAMLREQLRQAAPRDADATRWSLDDLLDAYLTYLEDQGRELRTRTRYAGVAKVWISPAIGRLQARRVMADDVDSCFARMRRAGQSASSMNQAKALLSGAFKWARRTGKVMHNPMAGFQLPKSIYMRREKLPPEAADISVILNAARQYTPDIASILVLAVTTGARLGELVAPRWSDIDWERKTLRIHAAADANGSLRETKRAQHRRDVPLDDGTLDVLRAVVDEAERRSRVLGVPLPRDPFIFSIEPDSSLPIRPGYVTRRLQTLKGRLGAEDKRPETVALEDEALRLRREGRVDRTGRRGPGPKDGNAMSYDDIAATLGRSQMWARRACDAALRRELAGGIGVKLNLSFNGFRKFTSSELLDAGFNLSVVAQRQDHGPEVITTHYSKARMSVRRQAAEQLGHIVHGSAATHGDPAGTRNARPSIIA